MTETEKAWFAGIVDGEGCLGCGFRSDSKNGIRLTFCIEMTHKPTMERIRGWFPNMGHYRRVRKKRRTGWTLQLRNKQAVPVIEMLLPYLVTKKEEANVWLMIADTITSGGPNHKVSEETRAKRLVLMTQLSDLKRIDYAT